MQGDTIIILKALGKDHIDEVIKVSREMNESGEIVREESQFARAICALPTANPVTRSHDLHDRSTSSTPATPRASSY